MPDQTPKYRVRAGSSNIPAPWPKGNKSFTSDQLKSFTGDSFQNFAASLGYGASNLSSGATYGFNPITRNHTQLEWMYRGSWLVKNIVDAVADDMTREGINIESDMPPDRIDDLQKRMGQKFLWQRLNAMIKWGRLYGGCIAVIAIDGQKWDTPLDVDKIGKDQFKGLIVLDRWMLWPHLDSPVTDLGSADYGMPAYYEVVSDAKTVPRMKVHHSRCIRYEGVELPYWQRIAENLWGLSVMEPIFDRLIAFDSTTQGAAQLVYRAHLRTLKIEKLRELIAYGQEMLNAVIEQVKMIRLHQMNEGLTLLDSTDEFEAYQYAFSGLSDLIIQFAQQVSGAAQIPLVRLFGQSPAGLNATGDADIRNYYDFINASQESRLRSPVGQLLDICHRSFYGEPLPAGFNFNFAPLWQLADTDKASAANQITSAVVQAQATGVISSDVMLKELRQSSKVTGVWSNITDEDIKEAKNAPPPMMGMEGMGGGVQPGSEGAERPPGMNEQGEMDPTSIHPSGPEHGGSGDDAEPPDPSLIEPPHPTGLNVKADVAERYRHLLPLKSRKDVKRFYAHVDTSLPLIADAEPGMPFNQGDIPMRDVQGLMITIESPKGTRRQGNGWSNQMAADYGYFNGTYSPEGIMEQLDCFVGDDQDSRAVWVQFQNKPDGTFDEYKVLIGFSDRDQALAAYRGSYDPEFVQQVEGQTVRMNIDKFREFLSEWQIDRVA